MQYAYHSAWQTVNLYLRTLTGNKMGQLDLPSSKALSEMRGKSKPTGWRVPWYRSFGKFPRNREIPKYPTKG